MNIAPVTETVPCMATTLSLSGDNEVPAELDSYTDGYCAHYTIEQQNLLAGDW